MNCCDCNPVVIPSQKAIKYSKNLQILFYCELVLCLLYFTAANILMGLYELINCLILYCAYRQLHYCMAVFYIFLMIFNWITALCYLGNSIQNSDYEIGGYGTYFYIVMWIGFAFYCVAIYFAFVAYREFKALMYEQNNLGIGPGPAQQQQFQGNQNQYQPPPAPPSAAYQNYGAIPQQESQSNQPTSSSSGNRFPGRGVRIGGN